MAVSTAQRRRLLASSLAVGAVALLLLALAHVGVERAEATGEGTFAATLTVRNEELGFDIECEINGTISGGDYREVTMESLPYSVAAVAISAPRAGNVCSRADTGEFVGDPRIDGTFEGTVEADGALARGTFEISISADTRSLGELATEAEQGIMIECLNMNLGESTSGTDREPIAYECTLMQNTELFGSDLKATITAMTVRIQEPGFARAMPDAGGGPMDARSRVGTGLLAGLAALGVVLLTGGALVAVRQRSG